MNNRVEQNLTITGARIGFRNFSGKPGRFNKEGERSFSWFIDDLTTAEQLSEIGWNIRWLSSNPDEEPVPYLNISVRFGSISPKVMLVDIHNNRKIPLDEISIGMLDWSEINNVDMIVRPYNWEAQGRTGVKAYLKTMYVTLVEEDFDGKYSNIPTVGETFNGSVT